MKVLIGRWQFLVGEATCTGLQTWRKKLFALFGTDQIPDSAVKVTGLIHTDDGTATLIDEFSKYLAGQNFQECMHYSLRSEEEASRWFSRYSQETLKLSNPFTSDQTHLRVSLIPGLLDTLKLNFARKTGLQRVFESGKVFYEQDGQVFEMISVAFAIFRPDRNTSWKDREASDYYTTKSILSRLGQFAELESR